MMASQFGGMEIEEVAAENPDAILKAHFDPDVGLHPYLSRKFIDGTSQSFTVSAGQNLFWGVSGLTSNVATVQIDATGGGVSGWDNFVFGESAATVPEPTSLAIFGIGALGMVVRHRRKQKQTT